MVVRRAQIIERTPEGVDVGQGPSEIGGEMDHSLPGGVYEEVTVARHCWLCKSVQRQPCSGPMLAEVHLEVVTTVTR